ncbi:hypothetical protein A2631_01585 [Candidatus Daviesbacteria bacterium RIFCSPHIGHO2_01_FULL_44_29]|uniref:RRM domain-containing protein n=1 Tax=Candidatus Daviesbacteria bacterium RIFCSPHIGHO2_02_FULL_43_12 TaxID=1797776 RepID=A0A1F5KJI6_9BACT|nr:MAG: hypothetical protein A2631_01585 [Candidatus Daviesbacteria bacterium RIFCSPHIGHO2_01_FULL_44_29]OGE39058.1 MAG: hypothetical protein A3E86_00495 [Candidatus Daviesbacteria bacterium RIFCSPHIGHO2_12_FULL_47_45]OGE41097.1 MAG: hypothetical protein A3D25_00980 [Candidatus Daviesbacteria bacterium RIFCSPHIGHO2_02_FULL_43_12]OGE69296.1 MAG: hypothetical protein A3B55_02720 [Candidatus Daviesbacteria bacterium RIFCSPLOWO2_01_FULL_43_15]
MTKLFIGGLPYSHTNQDLQDMFAVFGTVISAQVVTDKFTNQSKGFGFVEMDSDEAAQKAISELNGSMLNNRTLGVSVARPREDRPRNSDGGGYNRDSGNGGYNRDNRSGSGPSRGGFNRNNNNKRSRY